MVDFIETGLDVSLQNPMVPDIPGGQVVDLGDRVLGDGSDETRTSTV